MNIRLQSLLKPQLIFLVFLWGPLLYQLGVIWSINPQYSYGWLILPLCIFAIWREGVNVPVVKGPKPFALLTYGLIAICLIAIGPLWLIRGSNPDWRIINWAFSGSVILITILLFYNEVGFSGVKKLLFPLLFFVVAIPWPLAWDANFTLYLQGQVSILVADILWFLGYPVRLDGTMIQMANGARVLVDDACSGIRGFQVSLVVGLFLGYYYRLGKSLTVVFVITGACISLSLNLCRAFLLSYMTLHGGTETIAKWHDPAGNIIAVVTFAVLLGLAVLLRKIFWGNFDEDDGSLEIFKFNNSNTISIYGSIALVIILISTELWYLKNEQGLKDNIPITVDFSNDSIEYEEQAISDTVKSQLHYSEARSALWKGKEGEMIQGFYARWSKGDGSTSIMSIHKPTQCLGSRGLTFVKQYFDITFNIHGLEVPFEGYTFTSRGEYLHVFRCLWPEKLKDEKFPGFPKSGYDLKGRIKAALKGERNTGNQLIVFATRNIANFTKAYDVIQYEVSKCMLVVDE